MRKCRSSHPSPGNFGHRAWNVPCRYRAAHYCRRPARPCSSRSIGSSVRPRPTDHAMRMTSCSNRCAEMEERQERYVCVCFISIAFGLSICTPGSELEPGMESLQRRWCVGEIWRRWCHYDEVTRDWDLQAVEHGGQSWSPICATNADLQSISPLLIGDILVSTIESC